MKNLKHSMPEYRRNFHLKAYSILFLIVLILIGIGIAVVKINDFFNKNYLQFNQVIAVKVQVPVEIKGREVPTKEIIRIIESIPAPQDLTSDPEKLIYKYFGIENYRMAIAVSKCEGLNHPADGFNTNDNKTIDVGYMRINSVNFKLEGCSLLDVATPEGNIKCGYKMWDRGDGIEGNHKGNFNAWVGYTNGCALTKYE
jgi:hypothetical protein